MPIENPSEIGGRGGVSLSSSNAAHVGSFVNHFISYNDTPNAMNMPYVTQSELPGHLIDTFTSHSADDFYNIPSQAFPSHIYLRIVEQPVQKMRFRYESEKGSHGGLMGRNSTSEQKSFPSVKLENFHDSSQVLIKASLYTNEDKPKLHVHKLKGPSCQEDGTCLIRPSDDLVAIFQNIGISFVGKKSVPQILFKRKLDGNQFQNFTPELSDCMRKKLQKEAEQEAKSMNLNSAKICFEAFHCVNRQLSPLCEPAFSDPVSNQKSPDFGELKIVRMSKYSGDCTGGDEVYMLCEKVNKKEVRVRFSESDANGCIVWERYGIFNETDVHHQVAIVFRTPPYRTVDIATSVTVNVQLYRQTDGEASDPVDFVYKPGGNDESTFHKKKKRNPYAETNGFDGDDILASREQKRSFRFSGNHLVNSDNKSVNEYYQRDEISSYFESMLFTGSDPWKLQNNGLTESSPDPLLSSANVLGQSSLSSNFTFKTDSVETEDSAKPKDLAKPQKPQKPQTSLEDIEEQLSELFISSEEISFITPASLCACLESTAQSELVRPNISILTDGIDYITRVPDIPLIELIHKVWKVFIYFITKKKYVALEKSAEKFLSIFNKNGNNLIHLIVQYQGWNTDLMKSIILLAKAVSPNAINFQNELQQTPLHLAVLNKNLVFVQMLLKSGSNVCITDKNGNLSLHIAAENDLPDILSELLNVKNYLSSEGSSQHINSLNYEGYSPLHCAIIYKSKACIQILCGLGADINVVDGKSGRSALHLAVENFPGIIDYLLTQPHIEVDNQDYAGNTSLHLACALSCSSTVRKLMKAHANPLIKNFDFSCENNDLGNEVTERGKTPLDFAKGDKELKQILSGETTGSTVYMVADLFSGMLVQPVNNQDLNENSNHRNELRDEDRGSDSGYISGSLLDEQTLLKVCNLLDPPNTAWKDLALWLGVEEQLLDSIEALQFSPTRNIIEHFWGGGGNLVQLMNAFKSANLVEAENVVKASFSSMGRKEDSN